MSPKPPSPEELLRRVTEPFDDEDDDDDEEESREEFELRLDHELERTLAMTPAEIRADLEAMGYDVPTLEREAREFLGSMGWRPPRRRTYRLLSIAAPIAVIATLGEVLAPALPRLLPLAAEPSPQLPASAAAAAAAPHYAPQDDGGSDDARSR